MFKRTRPYIILGCCLALAAAFYVWLQIPTFGGAIDAYAREVMSNPAEYSLPGQPAYGYKIYNLQQPDRNTYECSILICMKQNSAEQENNDYPDAAQTLRVEKHGLFWQVQPQDDFQRLTVNFFNEYTTLPSQVYTAEYGDFTLRLYRQFEGTPDYMLAAGGSFGSASHPHNDFRFVNRITLEAIYNGADENKTQYQSIAAAALPYEPGTERPKTTMQPGNDQTGFATDGSLFAGVKLKGDWNPTFIIGAGSHSPYDYKKYISMPSAYAVDLYINNELAAELTLLPVKD